MALERTCILLVLFALVKRSFCYTASNVHSEKNSSIGLNFELQENDNVTTRDNVTSKYVSFSEPLVFFMFTTKEITLNISVPCDRIGQKYSVTTSTGNRDVFGLATIEKSVLECSSTPYTMPSDSTKGFVNGTIKLLFSGKLLGISSFELEIKADNVTPEVTEADEATRNNTLYDDVFPVAVLRNIRLLDKIFMIFVSIFLVIITMGFGCKLDLGIVKECLKKPIAPGVGFGCQYLVMPLLGFAIAKLLPLKNADTSVALGIFVCGVCPGGGASNIYSYLLDGDVSLSITMTFFSTIASIGMMPLWIYTLGRVFVEDGYTITIPYGNILQVCALITIPLVVGVFIKYKYIKVALVILKILKPVTIISILVFTSLGVYSNLFIFKLFRPMHIFAGCLLPYLGYLLGGAIAALFRQPFYRVVTIALETGMQNTGVAYLLMVYSFRPPYGDLASVAPMASALMTPFPPFVVTIAYLIYKKCCKKYEPVNVEEQEVKVKGPNDEDAGVIVTEKLSCV